MDKLLNKDSHLTGIIVGLILPVLGFSLAYGVTFLIDLIAGTNINQHSQEFKMIGIAFNLLPIRYFFITQKLELTGRGILLVTFIYVVIYFWLQQ